MGSRRKSFTNSPAIGCNHTNWMSWVDGDTKLTAMSLPGTHDSCSISFMSTGDKLLDEHVDYAKTQSADLRVQMTSGIRVLDIRCRPNKDRFDINHGDYWTGKDFNYVLDTVVNFVRSNPTEAVLMHVKKESSPAPDSQSFEDIFTAYWNDPKYHEYFWKNPNEDSTVEPTIPCLKDVRGKILILQDFSSETMFGPKWGGSQMNQQPSNKRNGLVTSKRDIHEKWKAVKEQLDATSSGSTDVMYLNQLADNGMSALADPTKNIEFSDVPAILVEGGFPTPETIAGNLPPDSTVDNWYDFDAMIQKGIDAVASGKEDKGINLSTLEYIFKGYVNRTSVVMMDFPGRALIGAIIAHNMKFSTSRSKMDTDFNEIMEGIVHSCRGNGKDRCLNKGQDLHDFWEHVHPSLRWNVIVSHTKGGSNWGFSITSNGVYHKTDWYDDYC